MTANQEKAFTLREEGRHLMLHGAAGSGKSFLALLFGCLDVEARSASRIVVVRSAVPTRSQGFLPGSLKEKAEVYEQPYRTIMSDLYERDDAYTILKNKGLFEFSTTSYIRGITLQDCVLVMDEIQNFTFGEFSSVLTRVGDNCTVICCGDFRQTDLVREHDPSGIQDILRVVRSMPSFSCVEFGVEDIVRSGLVKEFIIAKDKLGLA